MMAERIERGLTTDPGMGVIRHVDAGYDEAKELAAKKGVKLPMGEQPDRREYSDTRTVHKVALRRDGRRMASFRGQSSDPMIGCERHRAFTPPARNPAKTSGQRSTGVKSGAKAVSQDSPPPTPTHIIPCLNGLL